MQRLIMNKSQSQSRSHLGALVNFTGSIFALDSAVVKVSYVDPFLCFRMGKYKLIQGSPGSYNDWAPVQTFILKEHAKMKQKSGPQDFPPYQLFDIEGNHARVQRVGESRQSGPPGTSQSYRGS